MDIELPAIVYMSAHTIISSVVEESTAPLLPQILSAYNYISVLEHCRAAVLKLFGLGTSLDLPQRVFMWFVSVSIHHIRN